MLERAAAPSLLRRLLLTLLPALLLLGLLGVLVDDVQLRGLADAAYDQSLSNVALGLAARLESDHDRDLPQHLALLATGNRQRRFVVQSLDDARVLAGDARLLAELVPTVEAGPRFFALTHDGLSYRAVDYVYRGPDGSARIVVAEPMAGRAEPVAAALRSMLLSNLALAVVVLLVTVWAVRWALRPLDRMAAEVSALRAEALGELATLKAPDAPAELRPLIDAVQQLLARLRQSQQSSQHFLNACAHQLRTPLATLQAQIDVALAADPHNGSGARANVAEHARLQQLKPQVQRLTRLTGQMLALARAEAATALDQPAALLDLEPLLQELADEYLDAALSRGVELALETQPTTVRGQRWMLREMLANLLDNALRHAPPGSEVVLRCAPLAQGGSFAEVEDAGPGIAPADRERVFEPFVRLNEQARGGAGLGLSIVREVARQHGAQLLIADGAGQRGARVRIVLGAGTVVGVGAATGATESSARQPGFQSGEMHR